MILKYKSYTAMVNYDSKEKIYHGKVIDIDDLILVEGKTVFEIEKDFYTAIDDYLSKNNNDKEI